MARRLKTYRSQPPRSRRVAEPTVSTTMRLRRSVRQGLESLAERSRRSLSDLAEDLIAEGIRMRECPGIYFATEPSGRTAKVAGSGLAVWEVLRDFVEDEDPPDCGRRFTGCPRPSSLPRPCTSGAILTRSGAR